MSQSQDRHDSHAYIEVVILRVQDRLFAVDVDAALEVRGPERLSKRTKDGSNAKKVNIRGQWVPVLDFRMCLGLGAYGDQCPAMLLLSIAGQTLAVAVDDVPIIHSIPSTRVGRLEVPAAVAPFCSHSVELAPGQRVPVLDPNELLRVRQIDDH